jgi:hypothetical protein
MYCTKVSFCSFELNNNTIAVVKTNKLKNTIFEKSNHEVKDIKVRLLKVPNIYFFICKTIQLCLPLSTCKSTLASTTCVLESHDWKERKDWNKKWKRKYFYLFQQLSECKIVESLDDYCYHCCIESNWLY